MTIFQMFPGWLVFLASAVFFWMASEAGFRIGRYVYRHRPEAHDVPQGLVTGSILGLVSFLLAFSFGIAAFNFTERRSVIIEEANAVGTAYLRADILPEEGARDRLRSLLRSYTEVRVAASNDNLSVAEFKAIVENSERLHGEMWAHPATRRNTSQLWADGVRIVGPESGQLMGGDIGAGRLVEPELMLRTLGEAVAPVAQDLVGRRFTITAAGTRESLDPIRFVGNRSTGRMGFALAEAAVRRGATVTLVAGHTGLATPPGVERVDVETALEMRDEVMSRTDVDVVVKAAAVADFRPVAVSQRKIKKGEGIPTIELARNPDILAEIGERRREFGKGPKVLVGFAAETHDVEQYGREKLERKGADLLVVNDVSRPDAGFGSSTNDVVLLGADGSREEIPLAHKEQVAHHILDRIAALLD